jgi:ribosomal protein S18 acetylase RimI-like enzyme
MPVRPFHPDDIEPLMKILNDTKVFRQDELEVARELMEIAATQPEQRDYELATFVDETGEPQGYYCMGHTPMTEGTYDLYWIATRPALHGKGVGSELLRHCEERVRRAGGRLIVAETSSKPSYERTRAFYVRKGYREQGRISNYYARGDDLVLYVKQLQEDQ